MLKRSPLMALIAALLLALTACQSAAPAATPTPVAPTVESTLAPTVPAPTVPAPTEVPATSTPEPPATLDTAGWRELLSYVSPEYLDRRSGDVIGPGIGLLDVAQVRADLSIPMISGEDPSKAKINLILGLNTQGFGLKPLDSTSPSFFGTWGWDIADVDQVLLFHEDYTYIVRGRFNNSAIKAAFEKQGYQSSAQGEFTLYLKEVKPPKHQQPQFAWKADTLIIGETEAAIKSLIERKASGKPGLDEAPALQAVLERSMGRWGVYFAPPGSMSGYAYWLKIHSMLASESSVYRAWVEARSGQDAAIAWDVMAVSWQGKLPSDLQFLYVYGTEQQAADDVDLVKSSMTDAPDFNHNRPWSKVLTDVTVERERNVIIGQATTTNEGLLGSAIQNEEWALLPIRVGASAASAAQPSATRPDVTALDNGWYLYTMQSDGFALPLPPHWVQVDLRAGAIDAMLAPLMEKNPRFKEIMSDQVRQALKAGFKFLGFDFPDDATSDSYAAANVMKVPNTGGMPLETVARTLLNQYNEATFVVKPVKMQRVRLPVGEAREYQFHEKLVDATGKAREIAITQCLIVSGEDLYLITLSAMSDQAEAYAADFEQIIQGFQLVK